MCIPGRMVRGVSVHTREDGEGCGCECECAYQGGW